MKRRPTPQQRLAERVKIILHVPWDLPNIEVAEELGISRFTVGMWRTRFVERRLDGLVDESRPGTPRTITDANAERVITMTLESKLKHATDWSIRSMAKAAGMSQPAIARIWRTFSLQRNRVETSKLPEDPCVIEKVRAVVGLCVSPPEHAIVLCINEERQVQVLDHTQPLLPLRPGQVERRTHDYVRHGTTSLFAALDTVTGAVIGKCLRRHRHQEFPHFLRHPDATLPRPAGTTIHLILDNYRTHKTLAVQHWFTRHPAYQLHFPPTIASWLNLVEQFFAEITRNASGVVSFVASVPWSKRFSIPSNTITTIPSLLSAADTDLILAKVQKVCEGIFDSGH